ncbi:hypothetical protein CBR_g18980, partial [Chara braunii]
DNALVVFVDNLGGKFFRSRSGLDTAARTEVDVWSARTVTAATAVLLGVSPPVTIDSATAEKLDDLLRPDPFVRPQSVFSLLLSGASRDVLSANGTAFSSAGIDNFQWRNLVVDASTEHKGTQQEMGSHLLRLLSAIPKTAGEEVRVLHVGCQDASECGAKCMDEALLSVAESAGGQYKPDSEAGKGVLTVNFPEGGFIELDMKKTADSELLTELVCLHRSIEQLVKRQQESPLSASDQPELIISTMSASEELWQDSDSVRAANVGRFLFSCLAQELKKYLLGYDGKATVQIAFLGDNAGDMHGKSMNAIQDLRRELLRGYPADVIAATMLVRRAVAWTTGIIVLIGVLLGLCCLCYMPTTRDSLLYSGAKLD